MSAAAAVTKALIRRQLGTDAPTPLVEQAHREARTHYSAFMRDLPHGGDSVAQLVVVRATYAALLPQLMAKALAAGVESKAGRELLELAMRLDQRCERLAVTTLDIATRLAEVERRKPGASFPWLVANDEPTRPAEGVSNADDDEPHDTDDGAAAGPTEGEEDAP